MNNSENSSPSAPANPSGQSNVAPEADTDAEDRNQSPTPPDAKDKPAADAEKPAEIGGRGGADPTRFGDWEIGGRCVDF